MNSDLGRQVVGEFVQLPPAAYRHQDARRVLLDGGFNDCDRVADPFEGVAEIQSSGDRKAALDALLEK